MKVAAGNEPFRSVPEPLIATRRALVPGITVEPAEEPGLSSAEEL